LPAADTKDPEIKVTAVPEEVIKKYKLDTTFYKKHIDYKGFSILSSAKVSDTGLLEARFLIDKLLGEREDILKAMIKAGCRFMVMAPTEMTTDVPEQRHWDKAYWDKRARGMGGNITSCAEENLLGYPGTRYYGEHITVHEFSHNIMSALRTADPALFAKIQPAYDAAKAKGLYHDARGQEQYAINTVAEYFAEGTQWWFWSNIEFYDGTTKQRVQTPDEFKAYDPGLYAILGEIYGTHHLAADVYYGKNLRPAARPRGDASMPHF